MYDLNISFKQPTTKQDLALIASILRILESEPQFRNGKELFYNNNLIVNHHVIVSPNEEHITREPIPYEDFVRLVKIGMEATLELTVETEDGPETECRQFLPVTMFEIPSAKAAGIVLNYVPEFIPTAIGPDGPEMSFTGELHKLFCRDIGFQKE